MAKQYLHSLTLKWEDFKLFDMDMDMDMDIDMDDILLEGLQPHPKLRELSIRGYLGQMLPSWMTTGNIVNSLPNIVRITLENCERCEHLPQSLEQLPSLKFLELQRLNRVEHINDDENSNNQVVVERKSSSTEGMSVFFPSLEELVIQKMPELKGWWRAAETSSMMTEEEEEEREESSFPPRLTKLQVVDCPKLTSMLIHPSHLEKLTVGGMVQEKLVRQLLATTTTTTTGAITETEGSASSPSSSTTTVSKLKFLRILSMDDLESLPEEELLWKNLSSLDTLQIFDIRNLVSLPVWLQQLTTLQHLRISYCPGLMAIPDWLSNLTSLQSLEIDECPLLSERCQKETGEDWSKISHIPTIEIHSVKEWLI